MSARQANRGTQGDQIFTKVGLLVFLGVFLMGLGAERPLWASVYRAFFVWLAVCLVGGALRVGWKYHLYHERERELQANLSRARENEQRLHEERRQRRGNLNQLMDVMEDKSRSGTAEETAANAAAETAGAAEAAKRS